MRHFNTLISLDLKQNRSKTIAVESEQLNDHLFKVDSFKGNLKWFSVKTAIHLLT